MRLEGNGGPKKTSKPGKRFQCLPEHFKLCFEKSRRKKLCRVFRAPQPPTFMNQREENQLFDFFFLFLTSGKFVSYADGGAVSFTASAHLSTQYTCYCCCYLSSHTQPNPVSHISIKQKSFLKTELLTPFRKKFRGGILAHTFITCRVDAGFFKKLKCDTV